MVSAVSPQELYERSQAGEAVDLIDVRTPVEFQEVHVGLARNVPLDRLDAQALASDASARSTPLYVICRSGSRARKACEAIEAVGGRPVVNVEGGTAAWEAAGYPVVRGRKAISLERQVRIAAGSIVFVGSLLALFVHPWLVAIPAFVGAGLVFAGVTDTCGMGMLIARMPWNQVGTKNANCEKGACGV